MTWRASAYLETPLAISRQRATGNDLLTLEFIPGTTVRGALARLYLQTGAAEDPQFVTLFLAEKVRFGDLRIDGCHPWPLSARRCAQHPEHPVTDLLLRYGAQQEGTANIRRECSVCEAKLQQPQDYCRFNSDLNKYESCEVAVRRVAHVAIDPELLRSRSGQFHSARVLTRNQKFEGRIWADSESSRVLEDFVGSSRNLWVGRGRSRGQGRVAFSIDPDDGASAEGLEQRIRSLNQVAAQAFPIFRNHILFSCTLHSAAILLDEWLLSRHALGPTDIAEELADYTLLNSFTYQVDIAGWNAGPKAQLPKPEVRALAAGSSFLFIRASAGDDEKEYRRLAQILAKIEDEGLGERREEGFGEVRFCLSFHYQGATT